MRKIWAQLGIALLGVGLLPEVSSGAFLPAVVFSSPAYELETATDRFRVDVKIDADRTTLEIDPIPGGLTSFGVKLVFNPLAGRVLSIDDIAVTPAMDHGPLGGPAERFVGLTSASTKAFVGLVDPAYTGADLVSFYVTGNSAEPYVLSLGLFEQGENDAAFVDGNGVELDELLTFGSARVQVIPEPAMGLLGGVGAVMVLRRRR